MTNPVDIVKRMDEAFRNKDEATLREALHPDYTFKTPRMTLQGREAAVQFLIYDCACTFHNENSLFITEGNTVVHLFDWVVEAPFQGRYRMAEYLTVEGNQVRSAELFYDPTAFPPEFLEQLANTTREKTVV